MLAVGTAASQTAPPAKKFTQIAIGDPKDTIGGGPDAQTLALQTQLSEVLKYSLSAQEAVTGPAGEQALALLNQGAPEGSRWHLVTVGGAQVLEKTFPLQKWGTSQGLAAFANNVNLLATVTRHFPESRTAYGPAGPECTVGYTTHDLPSEDHPRGQVHANDFLVAARTDGLHRAVLASTPPPKA